MAVVETRDEDRVEDLWERVEVEGKTPADIDALLVVCGFEEVEEPFCTEEEIVGELVDEVELEPEDADPLADEDVAGPDEDKDAGLLEELPDTLLVDEVVAEADEVGALVEELDEGTGMLEAVKSLPFDELTDPWLDELEIVP